jgi:prepilin-type N-terminal cleavage/methylation domain-containing protein
MLRKADRRTVHALHRAEGFTLIEMLVAMVIGVVITGALLAILEFSLRQNSRISDRVQTDRTGRLALAKITDELRSSCTGFGSTAIQAPSSTPSSPLAAGNGSNLWFLSAYGNSTSGDAVITGLKQHDINWTETSQNSSGERLGTLTDYSFTGSGSSPDWTFPALSTANATARVLAKNVIPPSKGTTIFHYYKYDTTSTSPTYGELIELSSSELPLTTTSAKTVAKVSISFTQAPESKDTRAGHTTAFDGGSVVLRFTPLESAGESGVCA